MMFSLGLEPERGSYSVSADYGVVTTSTVGGMPRQRRQRVGDLFSVSASYLVTAAEFSYLMRFFRVVADMSFHAPLLLDSPEVAQYETRLVSPVQHQQLAPDAYRVSVSYLVRGGARSLGEDSAYVYFASMKKEDYAEYVNMLEKLANVDLPAALRGAR